jgi:hypothetical protein
VNRGATAPRWTPRDPVLLPARDRRDD